MGLAELFLIAVGLSMDAFAVAICIGLSLKKINFRKALTVGLYFGLFQAVMPWLGYTLGSRFADKIIAVDHWIAFLLLALIGGKMIKESFAPGYVSDGAEASLKFRDMLPLALATSIDALAVGVSFSFLNVHIAPAVAFIGLITLGLSMLGIGIGHAFGIKFKSKAEFIGGAILILMGLKILLEHLGVIFA